MKIKNISPTIITLRSKEGVDKLNPLETVEIKKANEKFAEMLIKEKKLELVQTKTASKDI